jgi:hypothetical protein
MPRWPIGEAEVEQLVGRRELEHVTGAAADGAPLLIRARRSVTTAASLVQDDPYSAYVLAYDAARSGRRGAAARVVTAGDTVQAGSPPEVRQDGPARVR